MKITKSLLREMIEQEVEIAKQERQMQEGIKTDIAAAALAFTSLVGYMGYNISKADEMTEFVKEMRVAEYDRASFEKLLPPEEVQKVKGNDVAYKTLIDSVAFEAVNSTPAQAKIVNGVPVLGAK